MTSYRDMHYQAEGLAYVRGMPPDDIPIYLEREKSIKLLKGLSASKGFKYVEEHGVEWLLNAAFRTRRFEKTPPCQRGLTTPAKCKYRIDPAKEEGWYTTARPTAFRLESMGPSQRCGHLLKQGRIGGRWDDYEPCIHPWTK